MRHAWAMPMPMMIALMYRGQCPEHDERGQRERSDQHDPEEQRDRDDHRDTACWRLGRTHGGRRLGRLRAGPGAGHGARRTAIEQGLEHDRSVARPTAQ